ncbi:unnamed protein product [Prorocentrum cordatum]|uniref:Sulfhydryl oxidase n=1 Tax=Prorocentrum cordatum TaxID=2364126 RepID=A0ABN9RAS4_9DINO|nr:unnamed protein product [Polarella glacialis]
MAFRAAVLAALPASCSSISYIRKGSAQDAGFLEEVAEDEIMHGLMEGMPRFLENDGGGCKQAEQGTPCHDDVTWLLAKGFEKHPEWYPGYTSRSSFEAVQDLLYRAGKAQCPRPCFSDPKARDVGAEAESRNLVLSSGCVDAVEGDLCFRTVGWLKQKGLEQHPDWFPALDAESSAAAIQAELHRQGKAQCREPCAPAGGPPYRALGAAKPSLRVRTGSEDAASWMWDFPKAEVTPTTQAGKALMECLQKLLHATPENFADLRAECEGLVPGEGDAQRAVLVKESVKFISWAQHHVHDVRAKRQESADQDGEAADPAARPEVAENGCMDALQNSVCYTAVSYGLSEGIKKYPRYYEGLSEHSSFEKVQDFLWRSNRHGCPKPCPRKRVDITQFDKHPELLLYKKRVADWSIDEMNRYISGEWDGYESRMFDNRDEDPLPTADTKPVAEETHEEKNVQDMSTDELARVLDGDLDAYMPKAAANDTEPEKAANDKEEASASAENDSTPLFADVASMNLSRVSEAASASEPVEADHDAVPEPTSSDPAVDAPPEPLAAAPAQLVASAPTEAARATEPVEEASGAVPEAASNGAVADVPTEPVADAPAEHEHEI